MFAYISGKLVEKQPTRAIIDVQGIGYVLSIPASSYEALPDVGATAKLLTHYYVRDDAILLFGFATEAERVIFEEMLSVSGVGPKLALAALSAMNPPELRDLIMEGDVAMLKRIPGVGRRTAERLTVDLRDRLARIDLDGISASPLGQRSAHTAAARADALMALESLGLARAAAERSLRKALRNNPGIQSAEELVRLALREA